MLNLEQCLFPGTPVSTLLRMRPMSLALIAKSSADPFHVPAPSMETIARACGMTWDKFLRQLSDLGALERESDWADLPLFQLIDFLTEEHREFMSEFIPAIKTIFLAYEGNGEVPGSIQSLAKAWPHFSASLVEHFEMEETYLFPKIVRYEYCLDNGKVDPDFSGGSVKVFAALHHAISEKEQMKAIADFLDAAQIAPDAEGMPPAYSALFSLLMEFRRWLLEHSRLEREILLPRAEALEKSLYDRFISGPGNAMVATFPGHAYLR